MTNGGAGPESLPKTLLWMALVGVTRFLVGGHARWVGCAPSAAQRIYFANHTSHLDTIILYAALPDGLRERTHPVAAADYWGKTPTRRRIALDLMNCVLIERGRATPDADPLAPLAEKLRAGRSLIIFPEGTRGSEPVPAPFRAGLYKLGLAFPSVDLIPVYLDNLSRAFPKGAYLPAPISCSVRFGAPLRVGEAESKSAFLERARAAVSGLATPAA